MNMAKLPPLCLRVLRPAIHWLRLAMALLRPAIHGLRPATQFQDFSSLCLGILRPAIPGLRPATNFRNFILCFIGSVSLVTARKGWVAARNTESDLVFSLVLIRSVSRFDSVTIPHYSI